MTMPELCGIIWHHYDFLFSLYYQLSLDFLSLLLYIDLIWSSGTSQTQSVYEAATEAQPLDSALLTA